LLSSACQINIGTEELTPNSEESLNWTWLKSRTTEKAQSRLVHQEVFGDGNKIRLLQSMSMFDNKAFCFNDGLYCYVFDIDSKIKYNTRDLPEESHHNNAQFLDIYYQEGDKYPLLLLSTGNYPPDQNEFYVVRVTENNGFIIFTKIKTIKNVLYEARNGGSWVADTKTGTLYMYAMTKSDWRVTGDNIFCVFSFDLPDLLDPSDVILQYDDVKNYWEYSYLIHQGGTFYNGYLLFNVQSLNTIGDVVLESSYNVLAVNTRDGSIDAVLPLDVSLETEGISVLNDKLYVSFKNGSPNQNADDVMFKLIEYTLPKSIIKNLEE